MNKQTIDLGNSFSKLNSKNFMNYNGCLVEIKPNALRWNNQLFYTKEELDKAISKSLTCLKNSIK